MRPQKEKLAVLRGTLDVFVLRAVSGRPLHGFEISLWLERHTKGALAVDDSALYQALHRLDERGFVRGEWGISEHNRRARYYGITRRGRAHLAAASGRLRSYAEAIAALLGAPVEVK